MNKIGWCSETYNPVIGCKNNCSYCYARKINQRFKFIKDWNNPEWREKSFNTKFPKKPQRIFVGSMSEIYYWEQIWIERVIEKVKQYPQHTFIFLSKFPFAYYRNDFPQNCWLGLTIVRTPKYGEEDRWSFIEFKRNNLHNLKFVCFEPLLEDIDLSHYLDLTAIDWVIVGAETGNRKGKIIPNKKWLLYIIKYCDLHKIPIFIKDNLLKYYPKFRGYQQFPEVK